MAANRHHEFGRRIGLRFFFWGTGEVRDEFTRRGDVLETTNGSIAFRDGLPCNHVLIRCDTRILTSGGDVLGFRFLVSEATPLVAKFATG